MARVANFMTLEKRRLVMKKQLLISCSIKINHTRNLQYLATEIFKVKIGIMPTIMSKIFKFYENATHSLRSGKVLEHRDNRANNFDVELISTLGAKISALVLQNLRQFVL